MAQPIRSLVWWVLLGAALSACSAQRDEQQQQRRRALLMPPDTQRQREERERKSRVFDEDGNLLESDQNVAGVVLPRGLSTPEVSEHQWFFKGEHVRATALERYIETHTESGSITRSADASLVIFRNARPKGEPDAQPLTIRVVKYRGATDESGLYIQEPMPQPRYLNAAEAEAQLKAQKAHAD